MMLRFDDSTAEPPLPNKQEDAGDTTSLEPGLILIFGAGQPAFELLPLSTDGEPLEIGRASPVFAHSPDPLISRQHCRLRYTAGHFELCDLQSRNGSAIDGAALQGSRTFATESVVRLGQSLFLCCHDLRPFRSFGIKRDNQRIEGAALQRTRRMVTKIAEASRTLFISGESGAGKEAMAQAFHQASEGGKQRGPFVPVNCAAIPEGVAERLLFGARKGAFSGAASDSDGYIMAADGGTLFLDEIADLELSVQGKLLRVIESGELLPLGATQPRKVLTRICSATHKDLRALVAAGRFRADLYFRIGLAQITVPPLCQRREEIPWLIDMAVRALEKEIKIETSLVEACLLRAWPGNVRELLAEFKMTTLAALAASKSTLGAEDLRPGAGAALQATAATAVPAEDEGRTSARQAAPGSRSASAAEPPGKAQVIGALISSGSNISAAARALGLHRTQLRRLLARYNIDLSRLPDVGKL